MTEKVKTPEAVNKSPFRKRRCTECKETFFSRDNRKICQNCTGEVDKSDQAAQEDANVKKANQKVETVTPQVTPAQQQPAKQKAK